MQRENKLKEIKGQVILWTLPVYEVSRAGEGYRVQTKTDIRFGSFGSALIGTFVYITPRSDEERRHIEALKTDDLISFKGRIVGSTWRNLEVKPAILAARGAAVPTAAASQQAPGVPRQTATGIAESIRAALASYAADSRDNLWPTKQRISSYATLRAVVNSNGGLLPATEALANIEFISYDEQDTDGDGTPDTYLLILLVLDTNGKPTTQLRITPEGVKHLPASTPLIAPPDTAGSMTAHQADTGASPSVPPLQPPSSVPPPPMPEARRSDVPVPPPLPPSASLGKVETRPMPAALVELPNTKIGDTYILESLDLDNPQSRYSTERKVVAVGEKTITVTSKNVQRKTAKARLLQFTSEWNLLSSRNPDGSGFDYMPPLKYFAFPLYPGKTWQQTSQETHRKTGAIKEFTLSATVGDWEEITVPAGTFRALKITLQTAILDRATAQKSTGTDISWYAPPMRRSVKSEMTSQNFQGQQERQLIQLLQYDVKEAKASVVLPGNTDVANKDFR